MKTDSVPKEDGRVFDLQRKVVSHMVSESWRAVPHVTYLYEPDITDFYAGYLECHARRNAAGEKLTFNTLVLYAVTEGLKAAPELNAHIEYDHRRGRGTLRLCGDVNISVPWTLPDGRMITPVLCGAQKMTLRELGGAVDGLSEKIRNTDVDEMLYRAVRANTVGELRGLHMGVLGRIFASLFGPHRVRGLHGGAKRRYYETPPEERLGEDNLIKGTVTVSNIGSLYKEQQGCFGLLEIIPPQIFAIGIGAVQEKPGVYRNGEGVKEIGIRKYLPMCLEFDHRAVDFNALVPFLRRLDGIFADPGEIADW